MPGLRLLGVVVVQRGLPEALCPTPGGTAAWAHGVHVTPGGQRRTRVLSVHSDTLIELRYWGLYTVCFVYYIHFIILKYSKVSFTTLLFPLKAGAR